MPDRVGELTVPADPKVLPRLVRRYHLVGSVAAVSAAVGGALVLLGWSFELETLKRLLPGRVAMNPASAAAFLAAGCALTLRHVMKRVPSWARRAVWVVGGAVALVGLSRLIAYWLALDFGLDSLLFRDSLARESPPNRMAPNTAFAFGLIGAAMLAVDRPHRAAVRAAEALSLLTLIMALITLTAYAYRVPDLAQISTFIPMALNTALGFIATSLAVSLVEPERGLTRSLVADAEGGRLARRLLPASLILPAGLAWLGIQGQARNVFDLQTGISAMVGLGTLLLGALILWTAETMIHSETLRATAERREAKLQRALRHRAQQIEAANAELEAFSYSVSHDLRAPLRSITGFSQALLEDHADQLNGEARDYLDRVARAGQRMAGLIDDLLRLSRVARADMQRVDVDLSALAEDRVAQLRSDEPARLVDVIIEDGLHAHGDRELLRIALDNLLENAWKYTSRSDNPRIELGRGGSTPEGAPIFFIRDTGAGFDMAHAHKLFSPFQRLHAEAEFHGSGIGLATVQRVMRRHGGRAWAEGEVGRGATFFFTLDPVPEVPGA